MRPARMHADAEKDRADRRGQVANLVAHLALPASGGVTGQVVEAGARGREVPAEEGRSRAGLRIDTAARA